LKSTKINAGTKRQMSKYPPISSLFIMIGFRA